MGNDGLIKHEDGTTTCGWHDDKPNYKAYHDNEWGVPLDIDTKLFEKICLEGFQAGLSWYTILKKREDFRRVFLDFDYNKVAKFTEDDVERIVEDASIVRHIGKIRSTINNAKRALELIEEKGSLAAYFWSYEPTDAQRPKKADYAALSQITMSDASKAISKDLKKRGWSFVGPTTIYAFMQSSGIVNDHVEGCMCRALREAERAKFIRPHLR